MDKQIIENTIAGAWATLMLYQTWSLIREVCKAKKERIEQEATFREMKELNRLAEGVRDLEQDVLKRCYMQADDLPSDIQSSLLTLSEYLSEAEAEYIEWKQKHPNL